MNLLNNKHLLGIKNLDHNDIELIFKTANRFKEVVENYNDTIYIE